jgi:arginyl-tRNA--protein-N-Asp/Glu arginylyltransferase
LGSLPQAYNTFMRKLLQELVVYDQPEACPYLPGQTCRLPLRMPLRKLSQAEFDARLEAGERRSGPLLYTTHCPNCQACQPLRMDVNLFTPSRTQTRVRKRGLKLFRTEIGPARVESERVALYNRHKHERGLARGEQRIDLENYHEFLVHTCCDTREMAYYLDDKLVMVAIIDVGAISLSAVYTFFNPDISHLSPGTYSVLEQVDLCRRWNRRYLYLGYYVVGSEHMVYKAQYRPHERLIDGEWRAM